MSLEKMAEKELVPIPITRTKGTLFSHSTMIVITYIANNIELYSHSLS